MAIKIPDYTLSTQTTVSPVYGDVQDFTDDGEMYIRELFSEPRYIINAVWDAEYIEDIKIIENFLRTYRNFDMVVTVGDETYTCKLLADSVSRSYIGGNIGTLTAGFRGVLND